MARLLLTSFTTWLPHQRSNSSDDLLAKVEQGGQTNLHFLRQLPVDFEIAPQQAIARIEHIQPQIVICCGMAESRSKLSVESQAVSGDRILKTRFDLQQLLAGLNFTEISHDAGRFVCNATYFQILEHLENSSSLGLFVHVPVMTEANCKAIVTDFEQLLQRVLLSSATILSE